MDDAQESFGSLQFAYLPFWSIKQHLLPFAMELALPVSDYYGRSVTVPLARGRPSQVPSLVDVSSLT